MNWNIPERTASSSIERFIGILIEHFAGAFPTWLAPEQVRVIPIAEAHQAYARQVAQRLEAAGVRASADCRNEKMGYKIREGQLQKVPYMLVVGAKEMEDGTVSVRARREENGGVKRLEEFEAQILEEIRTKAR